MSEATKSTTPEVQEKRPTPRDVAVDFGEYFAIYQQGRGEYDRPSDRVPELTRLIEAHPFYAYRIKLLDAHLERAMEIRRGFITSPLPRDDYDNGDRTNVADRLMTRATDEDWEHLSGLARTLRRPHKGDTSAVFPPDYTFSTVRHPVARPLLDLLNIAIAVDDEVVDNPALRSEKLGENGKRMIDALLGKGANPHALLHIREVDVLTSVFDGRLRLPQSPGKPIPADRSIGTEDFSDGINNNHD